ncbi:MAG TPA: hypothetical protein VGP25_01010 [Gemmatimonadaceae bacterium]|nr:hypothetical protein [Gemmatimonadaceae bacterium]
MSGWRFEVNRFPSIGREIALALGVEPPPECKLDHGRITLTFRRLAGTRWAESQQIEYAVRATGVARMVCANDDRRQVRKAGTRAIAVAFEDATVVQGCAVVARWECVMPADR